MAKNLIIRPHSEELHSESLQCVQNSPEHPLSGCTRTSRYNVQLSHKICCSFSCIQQDPFSSFFCCTVAHQNGGLKNSNHVANQRNSQHHNQRHPSSGNSTRPFLPSNINQPKDRGGSRPQPNLDCLKVPDQGAAG